MYADKHPRLDKLVSRIARTLNVFIQYIAFESDYHFYLKHITCKVIISEKFLWRHLNK